MNRWKIDNKKPVRIELSRGVALTDNELNLLAEAARAGRDRVVVPGKVILLTPARDNVFKYNITYQ